MKRLVALLLLLCATYALATAPDWQDQRSSTTNEVWRFRTSAGILTVSGGYRAYVAGADSSDTENQADFTAIPADSAWYVATTRTGAPLRSGRYNIVRISGGADSTIYANAYLNGTRLGKYAADDTTLAPSSVLTGHIKDREIQAADIDTSAVTTLEILDATILAADIATGVIPDSSDYVTETETSPVHMTKTLHVSGTAEVDDTIFGDGGITTPTIESDTGLWFLKADSSYLGDVVRVGNSQSKDSITLKGHQHTSGASYLVGGTEFGSTSNAANLWLWDGSANTLLLKPQAMAANDTLTMPPSRAGYKDTLTTMAYARSAAVGVASIDSSNVAAGALARSDLAIGGTATVGYVPKSTGDGWAWAADAGGSVDSSDVGQIGSTYITDGEVKLADLGSNSVDSSKIVSGGIGNLEIATDAVRSAHIRDGEVALADMGAASVDSAKVGAGALARSDIAIGGTATAGNVPASTGAGWAWAVPDSSLFGAASLSYADMVVGGGAIAAAKLAAFAIGDSAKFGGCIQSSAIADGQVKSADIQDLGVASADLASAAVGDSSKVAAGAIGKSNLALLGARHAAYSVMRIDANGKMYAGPDSVGSGGAADSAVFVTHSDDTAQYFHSTLQIEGATTAIGGLASTGATTLNGTVALGDASSDSLTFPGTITTAGFIGIKNGKGYISKWIAAKNGANSYAAASTPMPSNSPSSNTYLRFNSSGELIFDNVGIFTNCTTNGSSYLGDAAADSIYTASTFAIGDGDGTPALYYGQKYKNAGGTGVTTLLPPRITATVTANMTIGGQVAKGATTNRVAVYVAGMSTAGRCVATLDAGDITGAAPEVYTACTCKTDSVIVYAKTASAVNLNYLYWR